jgi:hypothetical protein
MKQIQYTRPPKNHFCCCAPNIDGGVDEGAACPKADDPKGDDCGVVVAGVFSNPNENKPVPETGVPLGVVVVAAGVLIWLFDGNEILGVVLALPVAPLGALVVGIDPFPNTTLLGVSVELPNTPPPNRFEVPDCCIPKGKGLVPVLFENAVVVFVLLSPNADF